ncbi:MAG: DMT family protein [bacterium]|nr:DMT family protein [bacterium]
MSRTLLSITFLVIVNVFMTFAWYGHHQFKKRGIVLQMGHSWLIIN